MILRAADYATKEGVMKAEGANGFIELRDGAVILTRKLFHGKSKGEKRIAINSITAIQFKPANSLISGYLQIAFSGSNESKGGLFEAATDENTIVFRKGQQPAFEELRDRIEAARQIPTTDQHTDLSAQLVRLSDLHASGVLSNEEFAAAKAKILG